MINVGEMDKTTGQFTVEPRTSVGVEAKTVKLVSERRNYPSTWRGGFTSQNGNKYSTCLSVVHQASNGICRLARQASCSGRLKAFSHNIVKKDKILC